MKKSVLCVLLAALIMVSAIPFAAGAAEVELDEIAMNPNEIVSISAGADMSAVVRADGTLWTWGCSELAQSGATWGNYWSFDVRAKSLGLAEGAHADSTPMIAFSENTESVVCGRNLTGSSMQSYYYVPITAALKNDGSLWLWGGGRYGVLGDDKDYSTSWKPYKVLDNVISYDVSGYHAAAVTEDGSLYMWGRNSHGQIGNGTTEDVLTPTWIMGGVESVSLGTYFSAAVKTDGSLWTWGSNSNGQLGNGTTDDSLTPIKVMDNATKVCLGGSYCLALARNGSLWVWGRNNIGQLGLGNKTDMLEPTLNEDFENDIIDIDAGENHSAALLESGDLYMWGANDSGELGNNSKTSRSRSVRVLRKVKDISLGQNHTLAVKQDGTLWAWGANNYGQLGDRTKETQTKPTEIFLGKINVSFSGDNIQKKTIDTRWDDTFLCDKSISYNQDMAIDGILLSEGAYNNASTIFGEFGYDYVDSEYNGDFPSYYVGYRVHWNFDTPHINIILGIRGTVTNDDWINDFRSIIDNFQLNGSHFINVLSLAEDKIISKLKKDNFSISLTRKNTTFFITGHSLGGACAGKTGLMLVDEGIALPNNVYVYTYAAPRFNNRSDLNDAVPRMFNIVNVSDDVVPNYPHIDFTSNRAGADKFYFTEEAGSDFWDRMYDLYDGNIRDDWDSATGGAHMTPTYLAMLQSSDPDDTFEHDYMNIFNRIRMIRVHCPVEVEVYDPDGNLCAYTSDGTITYSKNSPVTLAIEGDEKIIGIPDDREYSIRYVGTDNGTMRIEDQIYSIQTSELEHEKVYSNLVLTQGKLFGGSIDGTDDTENTLIFVVDDEGDSIRSVDENGNETELAKYDLDEAAITFPEGNYRYTGEAIQPEVQVNGLTEGVDYRLIYQNNTSVGKATVTVKGINEYRGRYSADFLIYDNGTCGDDITWALSPDGELTIQGSGDMPAFDEENLPPWSAHKDSIVGIVIEEGITSVSNSAFASCAKLKTLSLTKDIVSIGNAALDGCEALRDVYYDGSEDDWNSIETGENNLVLAAAAKHFSQKNVLGDVDGSGEVDIVDALILQRRASEIATPYEEWIDLCGDVDGSGEVDIVDALFVQRYASEISTPYPIGEPV